MRIIRSRPSAARAIVGFLLVTLSVCGCHDVSLPSDAMKTVGDVSVASTGQLPDVAFFNGPANVAGALGGLIGSLAVYAAQDERHQIPAYVKAQHIDLDGIVRAEFVRQLTEKTGFKGRIRDGSSSKFNVRIPLYGLTVIPLSTQLRPYLVLDVTLTNPSGQVVWRRHDYVGSEGAAPALDYSDYLQSAETFTREFEAASRELVAILLQDLNTEPQVARGSTDVPEQPAADAELPLVATAPVVKISQPVALAPLPPPPVVSPPAPTASAAPVAPAAPPRPSAPAPPPPASPAPAPSPMPSTLLPPVPEPTPVAVGAIGQTATAVDPALRQTRVPFLNDAQQSKFQEYLTKPTPRAFAISDNGHFASIWGLQTDSSGRSPDPSARALDGCRSVAGKPCMLFAVDNAIVYRNGGAVK